MYMRHFRICFKNILQNMNIFSSKIFSQLFVVELLFIFYRIFLKQIPHVFPPFTGNRLVHLDDKINMSDDELTVPLRFLR